MQTSFDSIKDALANSTMLHHPDPNLPLAITTDASDVAIGAVIEQRGPHGWEPLAFWFKKLSDTRQSTRLTNWCPYDRELNAAHKAIRHFKHMAEGRPFGQRPQRGRSPVEHRGTFVRPSVRSFVCPPPSSGPSGLKSSLSGLQSSLSGLKSSL